jgi:DNA polymerase-3 subunit epsilon
LADVYIELLGGRQPGLDFAIAGGGVGIGIALPQDRPPRPPRPHAPSLEELAAHQAMLAALKTALWLAGA